MKKLLVVLVGIFLFAVATTAFAEVKATVGVKAWANKWDWKDETLGGSSSTSDFGTAFMVGPSLNLRLGDHFFVGATYLKSMKDYESGGWGLTDASYTGTFSGTLSFERTDLDLTMGVMFTRYFGMFAGYKTIDASATFNETAAGYSNIGVGTMTLEGPGIGLVASIPVGGSAALYGNLAFMKMTREWNEMAASSTDEAGVSIELGAAVAFTQSFSGTLGYKLQSFAGDDDFGNTHTDTFTGVTLGLNYTF